MQDAERIFYRALTTKLLTLSEIVDMRFAAIQSATEPFGANSTQAQQTTAAFEAVLEVDVLIEGAKSKGLHKHRVSSLYCRIPTV